MSFIANFNNDLASAVKAYSDSIRQSPEKIKALQSNPTATVNDVLQKAGVTVSDPKLFHAHVIKAGDVLPDEPLRATVDRYIYIFRPSGVFEFKVIPGSPDGDDSFMSKPNGACQCCNCCVIVI